MKRHAPSKLWGKAGLGCLAFGMTLSQAQASTKKWFKASPSNHSMQIAPPAMHSGQKSFSKQDLMLVIDKVALNQEFLLSASIIPQSNAATSTALQGRVVQFKRFGNTLDVYDVSGGTTVTNDLPSQRLIAQLPIVEETEQTVTLDFNEGMKRVFTSRWIAFSDNFSANNTYDGEVAKATLSRVFEVDANSDRVVIRQITGIEQTDFMGVTVINQYEVKYRLSLYNDFGFEAKVRNPRHDNVGYFTTRPRLTETEGRSYTNLIRYDLNNGPVNFYYSANTPEAYKEAVAKGILYWNKTIGYEAITAQEAPAGVTAPDADRNMVQWVPWDSAGFAYADILHDPRTGRIVQGQAYMTSVFAVSSISRARSLISKLEKTLSEKEKQKAQLAILGMNSATACRMAGKDMMTQFASGLRNLLDEKGISDEAVLRYSQAYVSMVVAHEVGHIMGLRHNFAGNVASNATETQRDSYLVSVNTPEEKSIPANLVTSSSVMEYDTFPDAVFSGLRILQGQAPLPYDKAAIQYGYYDDLTIQNENMLFCTDEDTMVGYVDCKRFDTGIDPLTTAFKQSADWSSGVARKLFDYYVGQVTAKNPIDRYDVTEVALSTEIILGDYFQSLFEAYAWFGANARSIVVENKYPNISALYADQIAEDYWNTVVAQADAGSGFYQGLLAPLGITDSPKDLHSWTPSSITEELSQILESDYANPFTGNDGSQYSFTSAEKDVILTNSNKILTLAKKEMAKRFLEFTNATLMIRPSTQNVAIDETTLTFEEALIEYAKSILIAKSGNTIEVNYKGQLIEIKEPLYDQATRLAAAQLITNTNLGSYTGWSKIKASKIAELVTDDFSKSLQLDEGSETPISLKLADMDRKFRFWYKGEKRILETLAQANYL